jgi:hypothetical protein
MLPEGFEPTIPANERQQTHASDRAATGISFYLTRFIFVSVATVSHLHTKPQFVPLRAQSVTTGGTLKYNSTLNG